MRTSITILPTALRWDLRAPSVPHRVAALAAAWRRWQARRAAQALRQRALTYRADAQCSFAEDLAAAAGCTLDELTHPR